ncbi:MAG: cytochrome c biogenesis protein CcsA [Bacteroidia bacterium]|nr:cytochrome c biogenesis protein CcsA [Bacteroidia bacterium]
MTWIYFPYIALITAILWLVGSIFHNFSQNRKAMARLGLILIFAGVAVLAFFIAMMWVHLGRPPMRTLGETRLWYSFFLPFIGLLTYTRWKYKWFLSYSLCLAIIFLIINYLNPETHDKTLMPALQSPWFVPHVIVYIFAYALLAASSLIAVKGLYQMYFSEFDMNVIRLADNLVYIGFAFLTFGLLFGALWAKEAWGHYWTWDPKETWAFLTWMGYLIFMHYRYYHPDKIKIPLWTLALAFIVLLIAWFGINYLPSAANSVHVYSRG